MNWTSDTLKDMFLKNEKYSDTAYEIDEDNIDENDGNEDIIMKNNFISDTSKYHKAIYKNATPYIHRIYKDLDDSSAKNQLEYLNGRIISQNLKNELSESETLNYYVIQYMTLISQILTVKKIAEEVLSPDGRDSKKLKATQKRIENANEFIEILFQQWQISSTWMKKFTLSSDKLEVISAIDITKFNRAGEEFHSDNSESDSDDNISMSDAEPPESVEYHDEIYKQITSYIERLFECPDNSQNQKILDDLNTKFHEQNMKVSELTRNKILSYNFIPNQILTANVAEAKRLDSRLDSRFDKQISDLQLQLNHCSDFIETLIRQQKLPLSWAKKFEYDRESGEVKTIMINHNLKSSSVKSEELSVEFSALKSDFTHEEKKIVEYRSTKNRAEYTTNEEFVVQAGDRNDHICELRSRESIGNSAIDAYLSLSATSMVRKQSQFDTDQINWIRRYLFVIWTHEADRDELSPLIAYVEYEHRSKKENIQLRKDWLWRTTLRNIKRRKNIDLNIDKILYEKKHRSSWKLRTRQRIPEYSRISAQNRSCYPHIDAKEQQKAEYKYHPRSHAQKRIFNHHNIDDSTSEYKSSDKKSSDEKSNLIQTSRYSRCSKSDRLILENVSETNITELIKELAKLKRAQKINQSTRAWTI